MEMNPSSLQADSKEVAFKWFGRSSWANKGVIVGHTADKGLTVNGKPAQKGDIDDDGIMLDLSMKVKSYCPNPKQ